MKTKTTLVAALLCGLSASSGAFTLDFTGFEGTELPPSILQIAVPGYGDVRFEAIGGSTLIVDSSHMNDDGSAAPSLSFNRGESVKVTFLGNQPLDTNFDYVGISVGEYFVSGVDPVNSQAYVLTMNASGVSDGAGLYAVSWNAVPEPSTAILGAVAGLGFILLRRR